MPHFFISAAHKSSGKTTLSIGLCAALAEGGQIVQPFKKGPDYIDPMWLGRASGRACHNLDFYTMGRNEILHTVHHYSDAADITVIEGNKGLYDGLDLDGSNSNAALASVLKAPVILVLDARGMTRGIAPLILGYQAFDPDIQIAGVILNQLGGNRHESKLHAVIEHYTDVKVIGSVYKNPDMSIEERHLGLMPSNEDDSADRKIAQIRDLVKQQVDLDSLRSIAQSAAPFASDPMTDSPAIRVKSPLKIGVVKNDAFGFYYPGDLDALKASGAQLVDIDTIRDAQLPEDLDGLFIGGGFPETRITELEQNLGLRRQIKQALESGLPCYAECGGLMYLSRSLRWQDQQGDMVGFIPADCVMHKSPQGRGYVKLQQTEHHPWRDFAPQPQAVINGHEFHYSALEGLDQVKFAYKVKRGAGITGQHDGIVIHNTLACYAHLRDTASHHWAQQFVQFVEHCKHAKTEPSV